MRTVDVFGRITFRVPDAEAIFRVRAPSGAETAVLAFVQQDYEFSYDRHGYESQKAVGDPYPAARYTPDEPGCHVLLGPDGSELERFESIPSERRGFIGVSKRDPRYFAYSDGGGYVPIGLNLVGCTYDRMPAGDGHFTASDKLQTTGMIQWRRWFRGLRDSGANYARIWLSNRYTEARTELMGVHDLAALARFDQLVELARDSGVRLKLCFEHFRTFTDTGHFAYKRYVNPDTGRALLNTETWFSDPIWNERWLADIRPYIARCQNDPVVFAWELWNEIDCGDASFSVVEAFTRRLLPRVRALSPKNMVVNSLGSFDEERKQQVQDAFAAIPDMDFLQVHRYLDQGAPLEICHTDPVLFSIDAIKRCSTDNHPIILTETGAVNDRHVGPFRFYDCDHNGLIFTDVTYPAFFAGAAGSGHIWHWDRYVDSQNLWHHFTPLVSALAGVDVETEGFEPFDESTDDCWVLGLRGRKTILCLLRNRSDRWDLVLRDSKKPEPVAVELKTYGHQAEIVWLAGDEGYFEQEGDVVRIGGFTRGGILRLILED